MLALACADEPDVLCLQEVPVWAVRFLTAWSDMHSFPAVARRGVRWSALAGRATRMHNGLLRSAISGQANAVLVRRGHHAEALGSTQVSGHGHERRVCQLIRVDDVVVANTHLSSAGHGQSRELERALELLESHAGREEAVVLAGDLNMRDPDLPGFSAPGPGIDHVLVRGAPATPLVVWPVERRVQNGIVLSDHPPVELRLG